MTRALLIARDGGTSVWCGACNRRRRTQPVVAYVRAQRECGYEPRMDLLELALERLSRSQSRAHADYAERQRVLLNRL